jgi:hypothetical protein
MAWRTRRCRRKVASEAVLQLRIQDAGFCSGVLSSCHQEAVQPNSDGLTDAMLRALDDWGGEYTSP